MLPIRGLYEVAIPVRHLQKAETFYRDVLGLEVGLRDERRNWVFLRAGGTAGMVVLQEREGEFPTCHFAFTVSQSDLERAANSLRERGVTARGPVSHDCSRWRTLYAQDTDSPDLELIPPSVKRETPLVHKTAS